MGAFYLSDPVRDELVGKSDHILEWLQGELCPSASASLPSYPIQEIKFHPVLNGKEISDISRALTIELKGKCLLLFRGWWTYEVCFFSSIRQTHYDSDGVKTLETQLIGSFSEQRTRHIHPLVLQGEEMVKLGLVGERRAYVMQSYEHGDVCNDKGLERSAVIRLMCSDGLKQPSLAANSIGATIEEPDACHYVINIFLPLICHYPEYNVFASVNPGNEESTT